MINVIVVPEIEIFKTDVSYGEVVWINQDLGIPDLKGKNARYLAPFWITNNYKGVNRIFHIWDHYPTSNGPYEIILGNSFVLPKAPWNNMGQSRRFEYHPLSSFGFVEIKDGILDY